MTTPAPPNPPNRSLSVNGIQMFVDLPRWGKILVVGAGVLVSWYVYHVSTTATAATATATPASPTPDNASAAPTDTTSNIPPSSLGTTGGFTTDPATAGQIVYTDQPTAYWYVVSLGYGWSSTLRGISQQFYGDTSHADVLLQLNPGTTASTYARIAPGVKIKVPRSSS